MNPAPLLNEGVRKARGEILILQSPECEHVGTEVIEQLVTPHLTEDDIAVFAEVLALKPEGGTQSYCDAICNPRPYFFCGSIRKKWLVQFPFDESFTKYGGEDVDLAKRLGRAGVRFVFLGESSRVHHHWHGYPEGTFD